MSEHPRKTRVITRFARRICRLSTARGGVSLAFLLVAVAAPVANAIDVGTAPQDYNHRFEYWGTSLAWWGNEVGGQSNAQGRDDLVDIFFDADNGLGMNFVRYNIGAGSNPDTSIQNITRPGAKMEGWVPNAPTSVTDTSTWVWDWGADANQRLILDMAIEHGVTNVEAFANSAPWWMTRNLQSNGISGGGSNLSNSNVDEFAHYMLEVVDHFASTRGIHFETLAPMNEPGSGFWNGNSNQEGMGVPPGTFPWQDRLIKTFGAEIDSRGIDIKLVGLEETSTDQSADSWTNPNLTDEAKALVKQFNTHTYGFNGGSLQSDSERLYDAVTVEDGLKIYATEYGTGQGATRLARQINTDLRYLDAAGWTYWQAIEDNNGSGWGLAISNFNGSNPRFDVQDQYYAFKQYSAYIRPGSQIIELDGQDNITTAYDPRTGKTVMVINNEGGDATSEQYSFDLLDRPVESTRLIRTTDEDNTARTDAYTALGPATQNGQNVSLDAVGNAVTSVVISHRPNLIDNGNFDPNGLPDNSPQFDRWQGEGNVVFDTGADNSGDGTGSAQLQTNAVGNSGRFFQTGIGDADTDLTGVAYQVSADVQFRNASSSKYNADTYLGLEFYGADDEVLTSISLEDYETEIKPAFAVKANGSESSVVGSDPNDSVYRTYLSGRFIAPEGTRYVRPVVRFEGVSADSNSVVSVDNIELTEVHPEAAAREWNTGGGGAWNDGDNWLNHALAANNQRIYLGNAIGEPSVIAIDSLESVEAITFFSEQAYTLQGGGQSFLFVTDSPQPALIDARLGEHHINVRTFLTSAAEVQILLDAQLTFDDELNLLGNTLLKLGAGIVDFSDGLVMTGGKLITYASTVAQILVGNGAVLDGDIELLLAPGQDPQQGDEFALIGYQSPGDVFDQVILPELPGDLEWRVTYGPSELIAAVVLAAIDGDFNGDGRVDAADYSVWRDNLGNPDESVLMGAGDGMNGVDMGDYQLWSQNYGFSNVPGEDPVSVPEPHSLLLTLLTLLTLLVAGRRIF